MDNKQVTEPKEATPVFCKDCKHFTGGRLPRCKAPAVRRVDLVAGYYSPLCRAERQNAASATCGSAGALFEQKPGQSSADSASNRSSLSKINLASVESSAITAETATSEAPVPNTDSQIERAVTSLS